MLFKRYLFVTLSMLLALTLQACQPVVAPQPVAETANASAAVDAAETDEQGNSPASEAAETASESTMQGNFQLEKLPAQDAEARSIDVIDCGDAKMGSWVLLGEGTIDTFGESSLQVALCYDRVLGNITEGKGTLVSESGATILLEATGGYVDRLGVRMDYEIVGGTGEFSERSGSGRLFEEEAGYTTHGQNEYAFLLEGTIVTQ